MSPRGSLALMPGTRKGLVLFWTALFMLSVALQYASAIAPRGALAVEGDPVVTLEDGIEGCMGVRTTPGSENTDKELIGGSLVPGGTATFRISFPVDATDVSGKETFVITDCVFIDGEAVLKYSVSFVPNTEDFILTFSLDIPAGTPIGVEYCNFAKTTAGPSESQASNRKAGPACFIVGGNLSVLKVNGQNQPLAGATFHIVCTLPTTEAFLSDTIINGVTFNSVSGGVITTDATTGATGRIAIQAPVGTSCVITETDAPDGFVIAAVASVTLVASATGVEHKFVNTPEFVPAPGFTVDKGVSLSAAGPFVGALTVTTGTTVHYRITIANTGNVALTGVTLSDSINTNLAASGCTVPTTLAVGANFVCNYTAVAATGTTTNVATGDTAETPSDTGTATVTASPAPTLTIAKTNNAALSDGLPTADPGDTVTFTLTYSHTGDDVSGGIITDVLPAGLTFVAGTATSNGEFSFDGYNAGTRTLTWTADEDVTESGSLSYQATVDAGAAALEQPLENLATIDSDDTAPDSDTSDVFVPVPPLAETNVPTAPRTDTLGSTDNTTAGFSLLLVLLALAGLAFSIVMVTPMPKSIRNRSSRR